ncbi:hypothetical protein CDD81_5068 [Ophiocordyceps australis]|uniref:FAR1 domain-containing protein n=1 Tax=Ophiocordyceps australis TaxID=1399860 RepID=A0A2C5Y3L0_9HYPO|nr:hypothetical protein CDD81_5068 [Ophiocordyceps australis]
MSTYNADCQVFPSPPPTTLFDSMEAVYNFLQAFYREHGVCLVKKSPSNYREIDGVKKPTYCNLMCDRGEKRPPRGAGIRASTTAKKGCPFHIVISSSRATDFKKWQFRIVNGQHNHEPSPDASAHAVFRRRTPQQRNLIARLSKHHGLPPREIVNILRQVADGSQENPCFRPKDIYNDRQRARREALNGT